MNRLRRPAHRLAVAAACLLVAAVSACSSTDNSNLARAQSSTAATTVKPKTSASYPYIPTYGTASPTHTIPDATSDPNAVTDPGALYDPVTSPQFAIDFNRTTEQGYHYSIYASGRYGPITVDPTYALPDQTFVTEALDIGRLELTNTSGGRLMDVGQDDLQIGGLGIVAAWPHGSSICRVFASQYALPDGRCAGGLAELKLQNDDGQPIPADEPEQLQLHSPPAGGKAVLAFQIDDTGSAKAKMQAALKNATICVVAVVPGSADAAHTPGVTRAATCSELGGS